MRTRLFTLVSAFTVLFSSVSYAAATPSNAIPSASYSNAMDADAQVGSDELNPVLMSDGDISVGGVDNTVDITQVNLLLMYYDMHSNLKQVVRSFDSSGHASIGLPSDFASINGIGIQVLSGALPDVNGSYNIAFRYASDTSGYTYDVDSLTFNLVKTIGNSTSVSESVHSGDFTSDGAGGFYYSCNADLSQSMTYAQFNISTPGLIPPFGGTLSVRIVPTDSPVDIERPQAPGYNADDAMVDNTGQIAENTSQIVNGQNAIMDTILEGVQYIILQLEAFWNQLAGEFTNMFAAWDEDHQEQLANDDKNTQDIIDNLGDNTTDIINNNNSNTQTITDGFDNSGMDSDNDRLSSSLDQYDKAEDDLLSDVNKNIDAIDFNFSWDSLASVISYVSDFLQEIYERSGKFQIAINLVLITSLASCAIGLYRLKGGG